MTRYFYIPHTGKEEPITKCFTNPLVWILDTDRSIPVAIYFCDTEEDDLLFFKPEHCKEYYQ